MKHVCDNCKKKWTLQAVVEAKDLNQRVEPGGIMPSGQCPECGALCYPAHLSYPRHLTSCIGKATSPAAADFTPLFLIGKTVHVALVSGDYGHDIFVHATEKGLVEDLYKFVKTYWEKPMGPRPRKDKEKALDIYFEYMADRDEFLEYRGSIKIEP